MLGGGCAVACRAHTRRHSVGRAILGTRQGSRTTETRSLVSCTRNFWTLNMAVSGTCTDPEPPVRQYWHAPLKTCRPWRCVMVSRASTGYKIECAPGPAGWAGSAPGSGPCRRPARRRTPAAPPAPASRAPSRRAPLRPGHRAQSVPKGHSVGIRSQQSADASSSGLPAAARASPRCKCCCAVAAAIDAGTIAPHDSVHAWKAGPQRLVERLRALTGPMAGCCCDSERHVCAQ